MARFKEKTWADYDIGDPTRATEANLRAAVRRAAKVANQRLLRLERADMTTGIYLAALHDLGNMRMENGKPTGGRHRFSENPKKLTINQLRHEYRALRSFLSAKSSTVQGRKDTNYKRYRTAVKRGFKGTEEEFYMLVDRLYTENIESQFSSDIIYEAITQGNVDIIDEVIRKYEGQEASKTIIEYKKKAKARKAGKAILETSKKITRS